MSCKLGDSAGTFFRFETGMRRLKVEPILGGTLRALATGAMRDLQALRANP